MDSDTSLRLKLLRFPPIIGVIYIHAYSTSITLADGTLGSERTNAITDFVRVMISQGLARIAVPLFFLLSGYLYFVNVQWSQRAYLTKLLSRARSLLIPFLFWNLLVLAIEILAQTIPGLRPFFPEGTSLLADHALFPYIDALLGLTRYPIAYHFWFIRDLMLLALLAPIIVVVLQKASLSYLAAVAVCWISGTWPITAPAAVGVLFFSVGAFCAVRGLSLFTLDRYGPIALLAMVPILLADTLWNTAWFNNYLHRPGMIVGVVAALYLSKPITRHEQLRKLLVRLGGTSFFVYAAHEPLLGMLRLFAFTHLPLNGTYTLLALYLILPLFVTALLLLCHRLLRGCCPQVLAVITGGRATTA